MSTNLILGTAGHIDHGKTSLIRRLTGTDTDRLPEEKKRGITIELGYAHLDLDEFRLGIVDVPGHEKFVRQMLAGATGIDIALLVVAADDSIKRQTREHLDILKLLDIPVEGTLEAGSIIDEPSVSGAFAVGPFDPRALIVSLGLPDPNTADPEALKKASLASRFV